jgi:hypothetical protein
MKGKVWFVCFLFLLSLAGASLATASQDQAGQGLKTAWSITTVDAVDLGYYVYHSYTDIALDAASRLHISYRGPQKDLRYGTKQGSGWATSVVYHPLSVARENGIAIDADGHPHISLSFSDGSNENLVYARKITDTWQMSTINSTLSVGMENDIAIDSKNKVHISQPYFAFLHVSLAPLNGDK